MFAANPQHTPQAAPARNVYTRDELMLARGGAWCVLQPDVIRTVCMLNLRRRRRGTRAGQSKQRPIHKVVSRPSRDPLLTSRSLNSKHQRTSLPGRTDSHRTRAIQCDRRLHRTLINIRLVPCRAIDSPTARFQPPTSSTRRLPPGSSSSSSLIAVSSPTGLRASNVSWPPSLYVFNAAAITKPHAVEQLAVELVGYGIDIAIIS